MGMVHYWPYDSHNSLIILLPRHSRTCPRNRVQCISQCGIGEQVRWPHVIGTTFWVIPSILIFSCAQPCITEVEGHVTTWGGGGNKVVATLDCR